MGDVGLGELLISHLPLPPPPGTLHPNCQDSSGRPRRDIGTILQILNDLLSATRHYQGMPQSLTQLRCQTQFSSSSSPPASPDLATKTTSEPLPAATASPPLHPVVQCQSQIRMCKPSGKPCCLRVSRGRGLLPAPGICRVPGLPRPAVPPECCGGARCWGSVVGACRVWVWHLCSAFSVHHVAPGSVGVCGQDRQRGAGEPRQPPERELTHTSPPPLHRIAPHDGPRGARCWSHLSLWFLYNFFPSDDQPLASPCTAEHAGAGTGTPGLCLAPACSRRSRQGAGRQDGAEACGRAPIFPLAGRGLND